MTFDELMTKYETLIATAAAVSETGDRSFDDLVEALEADLAPHLSGPDLRKGAEMAAKELVSRFVVPEGIGAAWEGNFGGYSESGFLDPAEAEVEAPSVEVGVSRPPDEESLKDYYRKNGK